MGVAQELQTQRRPAASEPPAGRNAEVHWHGEKRSNDTHTSTTDPEARLARKSNATAAKLSYAGHLLMEHRNALIVDAELTAADRLRRTRQRRRDARPAPGIETAAHRRRRQGLRHQRLRRSTTRELGFTPHVAPNTTNRRSAIDGRTTRHGGHLVSQRIRKRIEEPFGWIKTIAGGRKLRYIGRAPQPGLVQDHRRRLQPASASPPSTPHT